MMGESECDAEFMTDDSEDEAEYDNHDLKPLPDDTSKLLRKHRNEPKKTYYPMQECLANRVLNRIKYILWLYGNRKQLSDFKQFDFQIYTARFCMLEEQTFYRLLAPEASCFPRSDYADFKKLTKTARMRVSKYQTHNMERSRSTELQQRAENEPDTLFLIIADEAHWGVGKAETESTSDATAGKGGSRTGANDQLINCWTDKQPNVIVLLVTATGYNLKSEESRLPDQLAVILKDDGKSSADPEKNELQENEIHFLEKVRPVVKERNTYKDKTNGKIYTKQTVEREFLLHNVKWPEAHLDEIADGIIMKLRIPNKENEDYCWLAMADKKNEIGVYSLIVTNEESESLDLLVKGEMHSGVNISTVDENYTLVVMEKKEGGIINYGLGFVCSSDMSHVKYSHFKLRMDCGEDVMIIHVMTDRVGSHQEYLHYNKKEGIITLEKPPPVPIIDWLPSYPLEYSFLVEYYHSPEQLCLPSLPAESQMQITSKVAKQYLSLNYYYNSMRNKHEKRLIRDDDNFKEMLKGIHQKTGSKNKQKHILPNDFRYLAAEYSYFIILIDVIREWTCFDVKSPELLFTEPTKAMAQYAEVRQSRIGRFVNHLKSYVRKDKLGVISVEDFNYVRNYYRQQCMDVMQSLSRDSTDLDSNKVFEGILTCLLFLDFSDHVETESWRALFKELSKEKLDFLSCITNEQFEEMKKQILEQYETYRIVDRVLASSVETQNGKMVVVRVPKSRDKLIPPGNLFYATLCLARTVADKCSESFRFEIIRDFGNYKVSEVTNNIKHPQYRMHYKLQPEKCEYRDKKTLESCHRGHTGEPCCEYKVQDKSLICINCQHKHRDVTTYEHLNTLPCILILVSKGRLGDTFPDSLFAMDCRLVYDSKPYLSTVMQEFGRVCRYFDKFSGKSPPYILIGPRLHQYLSSALKDFADFRGCFVKDNILDPYMSEQKSQKKKIQSLLAEDDQKMTTDDESEEIPSSLRTKKLHADHGNKEKHNFRILLEAEPQVGKTGVYLKVISLLRQAVQSGVEELVESDTASEGEHSTEDEDLEGEEHITDDAAEKWRYPYWKEMADMKFQDVKDLAGKYQRALRSKPVLAKHHSQHQRKHPLPRHGLRSFSPLNCFRTYSFDDPLHRSCTKCKSEVTAVELSLHVSEWDEILVSIPKSKRYLPFLTAVGLGDIDTIDSMSFMEHLDGEVAGEMTLKTWIVTPSYCRSMEATLNYRHTMVTKDGRRKCNYQHFIFVRESEFSTYCSNWDRTHIIVQLPNTMTFEDDDVITVDQGGIGYSRCFIQKFAKHFHQQLIFMLDDNVTSVYEIETQSENGKECIVRKGRHLKVAKVPLFSVLKHLENQFLDTSNLLDLSKLGNYEKYPDKCLEPIKGYIGPDMMYGLTGILKYRNGSLNVKKPFKKTHVFSLVLVNLEALERCGIEYKPVRFEEDISMNKDCNEKHLWICKFNRFLLSKRRLLSRIVPPVFSWPDDICFCSDNPTEAKDSLKILYHYIRWYQPPGRVELYPETAAHRSEVHQLYEKCRQSITGDCHFVIFVGYQMEQLADYLHNTTGIGGFDLHLILLCEEFWNRHALKKKCHFKDCLIVKHFKHIQEFEIYSSHSVKCFHVPYVLLYIKGRIDSPKDEVCTKSVPECRRQTRHKEATDRIQLADADEKYQTGPQKEEEETPIKKMRLSYDSNLSAEETKLQEIDRIHNTDDDDDDDDELDSDIDTSSRKLGQHYVPSEVSTEDKSNTLEVDQIPEQLTSDKSRANKSWTRAADAGDTQDGGSSSSDETQQKLNNVKDGTLQNAANALGEALVDLTLDNVEVYNKRTKKVKPLKPAAKLLKLDTIRLRPEYQHLWLRKGSIDRLMKKYNITHR